MSLDALDFALPTGNFLGSKTAYLHRHPNHVVAYNAVIFTASGNYAWHGDLDLTANAKELRDFARRKGEDLLVYRESVAHGFQSWAPGTLPKGDPLARITSK
jgi:hypothetical protein